jgi:hypothetical protein
MGGLKSLIPGLAEGGPTEAKMPYIVGERGPELFVPKTDGQIIPNHTLKNYPFRDGGGGVKAGGYGLGEKSTPEEWAKAMLQALNAPVKQDSIDALKTWARFEGGHYANNGTHGARYNPLNTSLKLPGSGPMSEKNQLVQRYKNWDQGISAAVTTLTGKNADARGYTAIVEALRNGAEKDAILAAINKSAWVHGEGRPSNYKFAGSSSKYDVNFSNAAGGAAGGVGGQTDGKFSMREFLEGSKTETKGILAGLTKGSWDNAKHASTATTYNYGGVSIKIDGSGNPGTTVEALKAALSSQDSIAKAARF